MLACRLNWQLLQCSRYHLVRLGTNDFAQSFTKQPSPHYIHVWMSLISRIFTNMVTGRGSYLIYTEYG